MFFEMDVKQELSGCELAHPHSSTLHTKFIHTTTPSTRHGYKVIKEAKDPNRGLHIRVRGPGGTSCT